MRSSGVCLKLVFLGIAVVLAAGRQAHAAEEAIKPGDKVKVINGPAPVKVGKKTLTTVESGTGLRALKVQGPWVKVSVERRGKKITGWIYARKYLHGLPDHGNQEGESTQSALSKEHVSRKYSLSMRYPPDWEINLSELLRLIQFFNSGGYHRCLEGEDGFCPGPV